MFSRALVAVVTATFAALSRAEPIPSEPGPGASYNEGSNCLITWEVDPTGTWKNMSIELMSGSNLAMSHITTIVTLDGTDPTKTEYSYPCPNVTPNSAIYFYQFSDPSTTNLTWTTRFTIADANGKSSPPEHDTEPNDDPIPWGIGALEDPSQATPPPSQGTAGTGTNTVAPSVSASASGPPTVVSTTPSVTSNGTPSSSTSGLTRVPSSASLGTAAALSTSSVNSTQPGENAVDNGAVGVVMGSSFAIGFGALAAALVALF